MDDRRVRRLAITGGSVLVGVALAVALWLSERGRTPAVPVSRPEPIDWAALPGLQHGPPPWPNNSESLPRRLPKLTLHRLSAEGQVLHIHQHLDVYVRGRHVTVPAGIGIYDDAWLTELHTHDDSGILHVESPVQRNFTLGELFGEWGVRLTRSCLGGACGDVRWWVNGTRRHGNPASLVLRSHQEIVVALGPPPARVPRSYDFPAGL